MTISKRELDIWFTVRSPTGQQATKLDNIRLAARGLAETILENTPQNADQLAAIGKLREVLATANQAVLYDLALTSAHSAG